MHAHPTPSNHRPRPSIRLGVGCWAVLMCTCGPAVAASPSEADRSVAREEPVVEVASPPPSRGNRKLRPRVEDGLPPRTRHALRTGLRLAYRQLVDVESCSALFSELGADGPETLAGAIYYPASDEQRQQICLRRGAAAFTELEGTRIGICTARFGSYTPLEAAAALIHEALHHAGMPERPTVAGALSSPEITELVRDRCRL